MSTSGAPTSRPVRPPPPARLHLNFNSTGPDQARSTLTDHHFLQPNVTPKNTVNDPGDPAAHNAEFHLCELPPDVPPHLLRYLPNINYSDALGDRRFAVLVTAARCVFGLWC